MYFFNDLEVLFNFFFITSLFSRYTQNPKSKAVYAFVFHWPEEKLVLGSPKMAPDASAVTLVGFKDPITFTTTPPGITLSIPPLSVNKMPCKWMWVFKLTGVLN